MSKLSYGLNVTKKPPAAPIGVRPPPAKRKTIFDEDDDNDEEEDASRPSNQAESISILGGLQKPPSRPFNKLDDEDDHKSSIFSSKRKPNAPTRHKPLNHYADLSSTHSTTKHSKLAEEIDPSIYDYDAAYDSIHAAQSHKDEASKAKGQDREARYMTNLLAAAEVRKRDALRAKEKVLAREREAEGDEYADKEKFVTGAYKRQQEEMRRLEAEEAEREKAAAERQRREGGGMKALYKDLLNRDEMKHQEVMKAVEQGVTTSNKDVQEEEKEVKKKSEAELAKEKGIAINEEGQVVDKRELLGAGLNAGSGAVKARPVQQTQQQQQQGRRGGRGAREQESKSFEDQLLAGLKRSASPEEDRASKSRRMEDELLAAMGSP